MAERRIAERRVRGPKIVTTRQDVVSAAGKFEWKEQLPHWTTVVDGRELPARTLLLRAAKVSGTHPINAEQAAVILSDLGFEIRYKGTTIPWEDMPA